MEAIYRKIKKNGYAFQGKFPQCRMKNSGEYYLSKGGGWTDGFYVGVLNLAYILTGDKEFRDLAKQYDPFFELRIQNTDDINRENGFLKLDHDVGMIFLPSVGASYILTRQEKYKEILIKAADVLVERFNQKGNFIRAWDTWEWDTDKQFIEEKKGKVIIDSMMNIPLLFQTTEITGEKKYYEIGLKHAKTMMRYIVRPDYSTYHTYNFDYKTGMPIAGKTRQGYSDESCWSRGQAWAVYGFALAYKYTRFTEFLEISKRLAEYFMQHLTSVDMPCWDFSASEQVFAPWDSSAAVICASGLLELWELTGDNCHKMNALRLLRAVERFCLTDKYEACQPLILHGCVGTAYNETTPAELQVRVIDQALVYADYFYLECILKLSEHKIRIF